MNKDHSHLSRRNFLKSLGAFLLTIPFSKIAFGKDATPEEYKKIYTLARTINTGQGCYFGR